MPIYPALALAAGCVTVVIELRVLKTGIFRTATYWVSLVIILAFMIPVDGWLTKLSAPIVIYDDHDTSALRPIWDILLEEFAYAFALITLVILVWEWSGRRSGNRREGAT